MPGHQQCADTVRVCVHACVCARAWVLTRCGYPGGYHVEVLRLSPPRVCSLLLECGEQTRPSHPLPTRTHPTQAACSLPTRAQHTLTPGVYPRSSPNETRRDVTSPSVSTWSWHVRRSSASPYLYASTSMLRERSRPWYRRCHGGPNPPTPPHPSGMIPAHARSTHTLTPGFYPRSSPNETRR